MIIFNTEIVTVFHSLQSNKYKFFSAKQTRLIISYFGFRMQYSKFHNFFQIHPKPFSTVGVQINDSSNDMFLLMQTEGTCLMVAINTSLALL
jgi:hypothetical protein